MEIPIIVTSAIILPYPSSCEKYFVHANKKKTYSGGRGETYAKILQREIMELGRKGNNSRTVSSSFNLTTPEGSGKDVIVV